MLTDIRCNFLQGEQVVVAPSAIAGITALANQMGLAIMPTGGSMFIGNYSVAATFFASNANRCLWSNLNQQPPTVMPMTGIFYVGSGSGVTLTVNVLRFFKGGS